MPINEGDYDTRWKSCQVSQVFLSTVLHPDTDPETIASVQRFDVLVQWEFYRRRDILLVSQEIILPVWVVWRRLAELGIELPRPATPRGGQPLHGDVIRLTISRLESHGPATANDISAAVGMKLESVHSALKANPGLFVAVDSVPGSGRRNRTVWDVVPLDSRRHKRRTTAMGKAK